MGALLVTNQAAQGFKAGDHASTFGGNPIVSAASVAVIEAILKNNLADNAAKRGQHLKHGLLALQGEFPTLIKDVRGMGLVMGIELDRNASSLVERCSKEGLLVGAAYEKVLRFLPPLIVTDQDIDLALGKLRIAIQKELKNS